MSFVGQWKPDGSKLANFSCIDCDVCGVTDGSVLIPHYTKGYQDISTAFMIVSENNERVDCHV